ncbi:MAG: SIS domain-containing protein [Firmicutes bacterium]|nr:SIS domain-containing protein [Bacillota bacterium]
MSKINSFITTQEIWQQPRLWRETTAIIEARQREIKEFIERAGSKGRLRVVLTGAGSSAFVGESVSPYLNRISDYHVEGVATTDIVANPRNYLPDVPTLLISFARSGNSPESVATVSLANEMVSNLHHIILTCNPDGSLARDARDDEKSLVILMPSDSNDKGFAMTGSFTTMVLASLLIFNLDKLPIFNQEVAKLADRGDALLESPEIAELASEDFQRLVYLGSSTLQGLARESALKMLELSAGKVVATWDSPLGFRHGPKSIINEQTLAVFYLSVDSHARKYELDLLREMAADKQAKLVALLPAPAPEVAELADYAISVSDTGLQLADDVFLLFPYILFAQSIALRKSAALGINPDNPSPSGTVNRVVKGVKIYPFERKG